MSVRPTGLTQLRFISHEVVRILNSEVWQHLSKQKALGNWLDVKNTGKCLIDIHR